MKKFFAILLVLALVLTLAACTTTTPAATGETSEAAKTEAISKEGGTSADSSVAAFDLTKVPDFAKSVKTKGMTAYWIGKVAGGTYWTGVELGLKTACDELGITLTMTSIERETDTDTQMTNLQTAVTAKPDMILAAPCDSSVLDQPIKDAAKQYTGPIVLVDTVIKTTGGYSVAILTDNNAGGQTLCKILLAGLKAAGKTEGVVAMDIASSGSQTVIDRQTGFKTYWDEHAKEFGCDKIKVLWDEVKVDDGQQETAMNNTQDFITRYGDQLAGLVGFNGSSVYCMTELKNQGIKCDKVVGVGMDFNVDSYELIKEGYEYGSAAQQTYNMGYYGIYLGVSVLAGQKYDGTRIDSGLMSVTPDRVNDKDVTAYIDVLKSAKK